MTTTTYANVYRYGRVERTVENSPVFDSEDRALTDIIENLDEDNQYVCTLVMDENLLRVESVDWEQRATVERPNRELERSDWDRQKAYHMWQKVGV